MDTRSLKDLGVPRWPGRASLGFWFSKHEGQCMSLIPSMASDSHPWSRKTLPRICESGCPRFWCILYSCCRCSAVSFRNLGPWWARRELSTIFGSWMVSNFGDSAGNAVLGSRLSWRSCWLAVRQNLLAEGSSAFSGDWCRCPDLGSSGCSGLLISGFGFPKSVTNNRAGWHFRVSSLRAS